MTHQATTQKENAPSRLDRDLSLGQEYFQRESCIDTSIHQKVTQLFTGAKEFLAGILRNDLDLRQQGIAKVKSVFSNQSADTENHNLKWNEVRKMVEDLSASALQQRFNTSYARLKDLQVRSLEQVLERYQLSGADSTRLRNQLAVNHEKLGYALDSVVQLLKGPDSDLAPRRLEEVQVRFEGWFKTLVRQAEVLSSRKYPSAPIPEVPDYIVYRNTVYIRDSTKNATMAGSRYYPKRPEEYTQLSVSYSQFGEAYLDILDNMDLHTIFSLEERNNKSPDDLTTEEKAYLTWKAYKRASRYGTGEVSLIESFENQWRRLRAVPQLVEPKRDHTRRRRGSDE